MSDNQSSNPLGSIPFMSLAGSSFLAQLFANWITIFGSNVSTGLGVLGALLESVAYMVLGMPIILGVWVVVTLPMSVGCTLLQINKRVFPTAAVGFIGGAILGAVLGIVTSGSSAKEFEVGLFLALNGCLTAVGFCVLSRVWNIGFRSD